MPIHLAEIEPPVVVPALARIVALTEESRYAVNGLELAIHRFPFKVGLESRRFSERVWTSIERRLGTAPQLNDIYLLEKPIGDAFQVSREHFLIDRDDDRHVLVDRGSLHGTVVQGVKVGGCGTGGRVELHDRDIIIVGSINSSMIFRFVAGPDIPTLPPVDW